jgi:hypothetical protein
MYHIDPTAETIATLKQDHPELFELLQLTVKKTGCLSERRYRVERCGMGATSEQYQPLDRATGSSHQLLDCIHEDG